MGKDIILVLVDKRMETALDVQRILTEWGCLIKTRLGIHDAGIDNCSSNGLIILELIGSSEEKEKLKDSLNSLDGTKAKLVNMVF